MIGLLQDNYSLWLCHEMYYCTCVSEKNVVSQEIKSANKWDSTAETNINNLALRKKTKDTVPLN